MRKRSIFIWTGLAIATTVVVLIYLLWPRQTAVVEPMGAQSDQPGLTAARLPDPDDYSWLGLIPGSEGDRVKIGPGKVSRMTAAGGIRWQTSMDAGGGVRKPDVVADADRTYVRQGDGIAALDVRTGQDLWRSPGPNDRLFLSGDLLLATDCRVRDEPTDGERLLVARRTRDGAEMFRVALPRKGYDPYPIREEAGLFLVQSFGFSDEERAALLIDRTGLVFHRFDREVISVAPSGNDRLVLTSKDVVRLGANGSEIWALPFADGGWEPAGGGLVTLPEGDVLAYVYCCISDSGVRVLRIDPSIGRKRWETECPSLEVVHSKYSHRAVAVVDGPRVIVTSRGDGGTFIEALNGETGRSVGRRVIESP